MTDHELPPTDPASSNVRPELPAASVPLGNGPAPTVHDVEVIRDSDTRPNALGLFGITAAGTVVAGIGLMIALVVALVAVGVSVSDDVGNATDAGTVIADAVRDHLGVIVAALIAPVIVTWVALAAAYKALIRAIWSCRVSFGRALLATALGFAAGWFGLVVDSLLLGISLGLFSLVCCAGATTYLLRQWSRPVIKTPG